MNESKLTDNVDQDVPMDRINNNITTTDTPPSTVIDMDESSIDDINNNNNARNVPPGPSIVTKTVPSGKLEKGTKCVSNLSPPFPVDPLTLVLGR